MYSAYDLKLKIKIETIEICPGWQLVKRKCYLEDDSGLKEIPETNYSGITTITDVEKLKNPFVKFHKIDTDGNKRDVYIMKKSFAEFYRTNSYITGPIDCMKYRVCDYDTLTTEDLNNLMFVEYSKDKHFWDIKTSKCLPKAIEIVGLNNKITSEYYDLEKIIADVKNRADIKLISTPSDNSKILWSDGTENKYLVFNWFPTEEDWTAFMNWEYDTALYRAKDFFTKRILNL